MEHARRRPDANSMDAHAPSWPTTAVVGPERSRHRDRRHLLGLVVPWALVALLWWRVLRPAGPGVLAPAGLFVATCLLLTLALTVVWISHNLAIHRAKGPRTGLPSAELRYEHDWSGRPVLADWQAVRRSPTVFIAGADRHKTFVPALEPARRPAAGVVR